MSANAVVTNIMKLSESRVAIVQQDVADAVYGSMSENMPWYNEQARAGVANAVGEYVADLISKIAGIEPSDDAVVLPDGLRILPLSAWKDDSDA